MRIDGYYLGYMASEGYGVVAFIFKEGCIAGIDASGVTFDGTYEESLDSGDYIGNVNVRVPSNTEIIQGVKSEEGGVSYQVLLKIPNNFLEIPFFTVDTPFGPVNVKLEKLRNIGE